MLVVIGRSLAGIAPDCTPYIIKVFQRDDATSQWIAHSSDVIMALDWCARQGVHIVNLSIASMAHPVHYASDQLAIACNRYVGWYGMTIITAMGNTSDSGPHNDPTAPRSPACASLVVSVGNCDLIGAVQPSSARGAADRVIPKPDLVAPGDRVWSTRSTTIAATSSTSTRHEGRYSTVSGTSASSAVVAGGSALLLQKYPHHNPSSLKQSLVASARPRSGGDRFAMGSGMLQVMAALALAPPPTASTSSTTTISVPSTHQKWSDPDLVDHHGYVPRPVQMNLYSILP
jgi:subtilisin family serine protease